MQSDPTPQVPQHVPPITGVATSVCAFIGRAASGPVDVPIRCQSFAELVEVFGSAGAGSELFASVRQFFENGGAECRVLRVAAPAGALLAAHFTGDPAQRTGLHALPAGLGCGLLIVPRDAALGEAARLEVLGAASRWCQRERALLLIDAPAAWSAAGAVAARDADVALLRAAVVPEQAALYFPDVRSADGAWVGAAGAAAGIMARLDRERGVWQSPAGLDASLAGSPELSATVTDRHGEQLNPLGVNVLRRMRDATVLWGARTLAQGDADAAEWKYIAVRRLGLYLERSLEQGLAWTQYQRNGEALWRAVRAAAEAFLLETFRAGALQGATPREAYFVRCDASTMTTADAEAGRVQLLVGFAALKPSEFIALRIALNTAAAARVSAAAAALQAGRRIPAGRRRRRSRLSDTVLLTGSPQQRRLAAEAIAASLQRQVHRVDLGSVVGKYIGETEKNLAQLFERAEQEEWVLLFDEADALFGKRTDVKDAHDRYADLEVSALLDGIRACDGLALVGLAPRPRVSSPLRVRTRCVLEVD